MKTLYICSTLILSLLSLSPVGRAEDMPSGSNPAKRSAFDKIKSLNGEWDVVKAPGEHGKHGGIVTYRVTAAGSAVVETLFGGTEHEMITVYYHDGEHLALTHYCMLQNRPQMREECQSESNKIVLKCGKAENAPIELEDHMHQVTYTFVDADHIKTDWVMYKGGKADSTHSFELARKKSPSK